MRAFVASLPLAAVILVLIPAPVGAAGAAVRPTGAPGAGLRFRWDIVRWNVAARPVAVTAGGRAVALASDNSKIVFAGSGTFGGPATAVTGGGAWTTLDPRGNTTATGTYTVKSLVTFVGAPGTFGDPTRTFELTDLIGQSTDARAGLAVLRIAYSDGTQGILVIGSALIGTPSPRFVGVTAVKGFVDYWEREAPRPRADGDRVLFHVVSGP